MEVQKPPMQIITTLPFQKKIKRICYIGSTKTSLLIHFLFTIYLNFHLKFKMSKVTSNTLIIQISVHIPNLKFSNGFNIHLDFYLQNRQNL